MIQAILLGVSAVLAVGFVIAAAVYIESQSRHHTPHTASPQASRFDETRRVYGNCAHCKGPVNAENGYFMKCSHAVHFTCVKFLMETLENVVCEICSAPFFNRKQAESNKELRKRQISLSKCVNCEKMIEDKPRDLKCSHQVHESCWARMEETSTTCPRCMESK